MGNICSEQKKLDHKEQKLSSPKNEKKERRKKKDKHSKSSKTTKSKKEKSQKIRTKKSSPKGSDPTSQTVPVTTQDQFDEDNFSTLLPSATLSDANNDSYNLEIMEGARKKAVKMHDLYEDGEWKIVKDVDDIQLYKGEGQSTEILVRRDTTVQASIHR